MQQKCAVAFTAVRPVPFAATFASGGGIRYSIDFTQISVSADAESDCALVVR